MILGLSLHLKKIFDLIYSDGSNNDIKMENYYINFCIFIFLVIILHN